MGQKASLAAIFRVTYRVKCGLHVVECLRTLCKTLPNTSYQLYHRLYGRQYSKTTQNHTKPHKMGQKTSLAAIFRVTYRVKCGLHFVGCSRTLCKTLPNTSYQFYHRLYGRQYSKTTQNHTNHTKWAKKTSLAAIFRVTYRVKYGLHVAGCSRTLCKTLPNTQYQLYHRLQGRQYSKTTKNGEKPHKMGQKTSLAAIFRVTYRVKFGFNAGQCFRVLGNTLPNTSGQFYHR